MVVSAHPLDLVLLTSITAHSLIRRSFAGTEPSLHRLVASSKATSSLHSTLTTLASLYFLHCHTVQWLRIISDGAQPPIVGLQEDNTRVGELWNDGRENARITGITGGRYPDDSTNPLIATRSIFANAITALECGYLLQDTVALIQEARLRTSAVQPRSIPTIRSILRHADKTLLTHHVGISLALLILQYYTRQGRERGICIIIQMLLMNGSTPFLNLRWWIRTYHPRSQALCLISDVTLAATFYVARVWLIERILRSYGKLHGRNSAWTVYWECLRTPCQLGTGALYLANLGWWSLLVFKMAKMWLNELQMARKRALTT